MPSKAARGVASPISQAGRRLAAQRVVDETGDGGAVGRTGEAVRQAPILEHIRRQPAARLDLGENLDGGGQTGGGCHA